MKWLWCLMFVVAAYGDIRAGLAAGDFPYERELILDVAPMRGSKRIPNMDVAADGKMALELWCSRVDGQVVVAADTITVIAGSPEDRPCPPERVRADAELLVALSEVTNWRRQGDNVLLIGPKTLRFRMPTN